MRTQRGERAVIEPQRFERGAIGQSDQAPAVVVGPRVPRTDEAGAAAAALGHARAAVPARVDERAEHAVVAAHEQHRHARDVLGRPAAGLRQVAGESHHLGKLEEQPPALVREALGVDVARRIDLDGAVGARRGLAVEQIEQCSRHRDPAGSVQRPLPARPTIRQHRASDLNLYLQWLASSVRPDRQLARNPQPEAIGIAGFPSRRMGILAAPASRPGPPRATLNEGRTRSFRTSLRRIDRALLRPRREVREMRMRSSSRLSVAVWTPLCALIALALPGAASALKAPPPQLSELEEADRKALETIAGHSEPLRDAVLKASLHVDALVETQRIQEQSSASFQERIGKLDKKQQEQIWDIVREPGLLDELATEERPSRSAARRDRQAPSRGARSRDPRRGRQTSRPARRRRADPRPRERAVRRRDLRSRRRDAAGVPRSGRPAGAALGARAPREPRRAARRQLPQESQGHAELPLGARRRRREAQRGRREGMEGADRERSQGGRRARSGRARLLPRRTGTTTRS